MEYILWTFVSIAILIYFGIFLRRALKGKLRNFNFSAASIFLALFFGSVRRLILPGNIFMIFISNLAFSIFTLPLVYHLENTIISKTKQVISYVIMALIALFIVMTLLSSFERIVMNLFVILPLSFEVTVIFLISPFLLIFLFFFFLCLFNNQRSSGNTQKIYLHFSWFINNYFNVVCS